MSERLEQIKAKPYFNKETRDDRVNSADIVWLINRVEELENHERNLESAIREIIETVKLLDEELAYDCEKIVGKWSQS